MERGTTREPGAVAEPVRTEYAASVIIPAYNEGRVIGQCLDALGHAGVGPLDVVVAANGCRDDTAAIAASRPGVRVLDLSQPSKAGALNAGDEAARAFPRVYLDADIVLSAEALPALVTALDTPLPRVAAPAARFRTEGCSWAVRRFYEVYRELPYVGSGLVGLGVYGVSAAGRARFAHFPDLAADDLFVQRLFAPTERVTVAGHFEIQAPRDVRNLVRVRTRIARGNAELAVAGGAVDPPSGIGDGFAATTGGTARALCALVARRPRLLPAAVVYTAVVALARRRAATAGRAQSRWHRDESTR